MTFYANNALIIDQTSRETFFANVSIFGSSSSYLFVEDGSPLEGTVSGYTSGGNSPPGVFPNNNTIDKFPFATNANATDVSDLTTAELYSAGQSSTVSGYISGGGSGAYGTTLSNVIEKFPFATNANSTDVGDLTAARRLIGGGNSSSVSGYTTGGLAPPTGATSQYVNTIDKFPFATNANATGVGALSDRWGLTAGQSSRNNGYASGSTVWPGGLTNSLRIINKFPFSNDANAVNIGNLTRYTDSSAGQSSTVSGYTSGGQYGTPPATNIIDKFPFASDASASDVGDLTAIRSAPAGQSSTVSGYTSGGLGPSVLNTIDKFPFASDANATDVGDLTAIRSASSGQQD
jgi:hypothetical protein